jgi:hypothetical protein
MGDDKMKEEMSLKQSQIGNDQQWADRVEEILRKWLLEQPYSAKLAFVLLNGYRLADDLTQAVFHEISENYKTEVVHAAEELPSTLVNIEVLLTGVAADMLHAEDRMSETIENKCNKEDIAQQSRKLDEGNSELPPSEEIKSDKSRKTGLATKIDEHN